jgi:hypothetical protein
MSKAKDNPTKPIPAPAVEETTANDTELRERLHKEIYEELVKKQISNSENFDRSVLTFSASALGLSLTFVKDFAPLAQANARWILVLSWFLFGAAIISTMISFLLSQEAIRLQIIAAERYYIHRDESALNESLASKWTLRLNRFSGIAFVTGMVLTILFVVLNLPTARP